MEAGHDHVERWRRGGEPKRGREVREVRVPRGKNNEKERGGASSLFYSGPGLWGGAYLAIAR